MNMRSSIFATLIVLCLLLSNAAQAGTIYGPGGSSFTIDPYKTTNQKGNSNNTESSPGPNNGSYTTPAYSQGTTMRVDYEYQSGPYIRRAHGTVSDPKGLWQALLPLQPPPGAHGDYGLIGDDRLLGQGRGFAATAARTHCTSVYNF